MMKTPENWKEWLKYIKFEEDEMYNQKIVGIRKDTPPKIRKEIKAYLRDENEMEKSQFDEKEYQEIQDALHGKTRKKNEDEDGDEEESE